MFESQLATAGTSGGDVPDEVRKYQEVIYGPRSEAEAEVEESDPGETIDADTPETLFFANPELVLDMLGREPTQVILGGPGSGKSTLLHYAMLRVCQAGSSRGDLPLHLQDAPIPFLIDLRNYVLQRATDFVSYIARSSQDLDDATVDADSVVNMLEQKGQALVLFDGLDEVFDPDERKRVINQFQTFAHRYPNARIVVTSRIAGYDRTALGLAGFDHYTLLPLTLGQIRHFAGQWYQYYTLEGTERTAQGLVQRIIESPRLLDLAGNPLLLTMMAVIYKDRDLPNERWRLYERCADTLLEDWDLGKGIEDEDFKLTVLVRTAQKSEILQRVSMYMLEHGQKGRELNAIAYAPLLDIIASYLEEKYQRPRGDAEAAAVAVLHHLMERTYVLASIGERVFGFVHRTFMEYFAACRCQAQFNARKSDFPWLTREIFGAHWKESEWEEVLLLLIAMLHDQGTPIREVIEYLRRRSRATVPFKMAFAARCMGEAGDVQDAAQGQALLGELAESIAEFVPQSKKLFVESSLRAFGTLAPLVIAPPAVQLSIDSLNQMGTVTARMAAWQMGFAMRSRKERLEYALAALNDKAEAVRRGAIAALEREWPGRANIGVALAEVVRVDRQARVRQAALAAMQRSWRFEPAILDAIASRAAEETGHRSVIRLIEYLASTWRGNSTARDLVMKLAGPLPKAREDYDYDSVTEVAVLGLARGWAGDAQALVFLQDQVLRNSAPETRAAGLQAMADGWRGNSQALSFLQDRAVSDSDIQTRAAGFKAIAKGWVGDARVFSFLQDRATNDPAPQARLAAIEAIALEWGGRATALSFVQELAATDSDPEIRVAGIRAIGQGWGGDSDAFKFLQAWATDNPEPQTRVAALQAIANGWGGDPGALSFFQERVTNDPDPQTRTAGLQILAHQLGRAFWDPPFWDFEGVIAFLRERALHDPDVATRASVLKSFAWLTRPYSLGVLSFYGAGDSTLTFLQDRARNDPEVSIRVIALEAIAVGLVGRLLPGEDKEALAFLRDNLAFLKEQATENAEATTRQMRFGPLQILRLMTNAL